METILNDFKILYSDSIKIYHGEVKSLSQLSEIALNIYDISTKFYSHKLSYINEDSSLVELTNDEALILILKQHKNQKRANSC